MLRVPSPYDEFKLRFGSASGGGSSCAPEAKCDPFGNEADADTTVNVTLNEFTVQLDKTSVPAGMIRSARSRSSWMLAAAPTAWTRAGSSTRAGSWTRSTKKSPKTRAWTPRRSN